MEVVNFNPNESAFAWEDISTDMTSLVQRMNTVHFAEEWKDHKNQDQERSLVAENDALRSSSAVKNEAHRIEVLLLTMALEVEKEIGEKQAQKYHELRTRLNHKPQTESRDSKVALRRTPSVKPSIRKEALRTNERRSVHQMETDLHRSRARTKTMQKLIKQVGKTPEKWKPSLSSTLDRTVERLISRARLHDLNSKADEMAILLHQKKKLREEYVTAKKNEKVEKQKFLRKAKNDRKELLLLPRLERKKVARKKSKSAKTLSEEKVRALLGRDLNNTQWREIQQTAYHINFTRTRTYSYFHGLKLSAKARRVSTA